MSLSLQTKQLCIHVGTRKLVENLELDIAAGAFVCVLGTNGVGKTLTLHTLAGLRSPASGSVAIADQSITSLPRKKLAMQLGLLLQIHEDAFPLTVLESVLMGCYPRMSFWQWAGQTETATALAALDAFDLRGLESRLVTTLSGGERERVALATLMVQDPQIWLLDEPMNHLDPHHQIEVYRCLQQQARQGRVVISTVHNPALAMRYATEALLLYGDGEWEYGSAAELLEPERLERVYQTPFEYYTAAHSTAKDSTHANERVLLPST